jgi:periodic tryptophan protein 1
MVTAAAWVPRGQAAQFPTKAVFDGDEYSRIAKLAKLQLDDAQEDLEEAQQEEAAAKANAEKTNGEAKKAKPKKTKEEKEEEDDDLKEYDLDHYDDDVEGDENGEKTGTLGMFSNIKSLAYYESNEEDPYITLKDDEDEDEREELEITDSDNLILAARIEDEVAHLEVYVYEDEADNLYVHHDIMLPAIPLTVEWLNYGVGRDNASADSKANFVAVGTMDPDIELWDLDVVDSMYPDAVLGQGSETATEVDKAKKKKKKKKSKKPNDNYHVDAVLSLAANRTHRQLLASASADTTVKLWDLNTTQCAKSYSWHTDKVCSIAWNPKDTTGLLSGSYDRTVVVADMRAPDAAVRRWGVESDVESVRWDPHDPFYFYVRSSQSLPSIHDSLTYPPGLDGKRHNPLPRRPQRTLRPFKDQTSLDTTSPRLGRQQLRHQPHHPGLPRHRLSRRASQALEHHRRRSQHGHQPRPRRRARLLHHVRARQGSWLPLGRCRQ